MGRGRGLLPKVQRYAGQRYHVYGKVARIVAFVTYRKIKVALLNFVSIKTSSFFGSGLVRTREVP